MGGRGIERGWLRSQVKKRRRKVLDENPSNKAKLFTCIKLNAHVSVCVCVCVLLVRACEWVFAVCVRVCVS